MDATLQQVSANNRMILTNPAAPRANTNAQIQILNHSIATMVIGPYMNPAPMDVMYQQANANLQNALPENINAMCEVPTTLLIIVITVSGKFMKIVMTSATLRQENAKNPVIK